jgi:hypothetical protein
MKGLKSKKNPAEVATPTRCYYGFQIILAVIMTALIITTIPNEDAKAKRFSVIHNSSIDFFYII